jgi:uncharacterized protein (DUF302 family)
MIEYGFVKEMDMDFESALETVKNSLREEGFNILTAIDVREKLQEKLGVNFHKYMILGACDAASAHKALMVEEDIGLMLPCNVVVYESDGKSRVAVIRPTVAMQMIDNPDLRRIAKDVERKLKHVVDSLQPAEALT